MGAGLVRRQLLQYSPPNNPLGPSSGDYRVLRGGSWTNTAATVRAADRFGNSPTTITTSTVSVWPFPSGSYFLSYEILYSAMHDGSCGLADLAQAGNFFPCEPYGTCWEPNRQQPATTGNALAVPNGDQGKSTELAEISPSVVQTAGPGSKIAFVGKPMANPSVQSSPRLLEIDAFFPCMPDEIRYLILRSWYPTADPTLYPALSYSAEPLELGCLPRRKLDLPEPRLRLGGGQAASSSTAALGQKRAHRRLCPRSSVRHQGSVRLPFRVW